MTLDIQALTMLHMLGAGIFIGGSYETYSRLRVRIHNWLSTLIQDIVFWLINGIIVFLWLQYVNTGEMRLYIFLSLLCGYAMYKVLFQRIYRSFLEFLIRLCKWGYRTLKKTIHLLVITPVLWLYKAILAILIFILGIFMWLGKLLLKILGVIVHPFWKLIQHFWFKWSSKRQKSSTDEENRSKNETLDSEGFFRTVANWLYKRKG